MASKLNTQQTQRFVKCIKHQLEILKDERDTMQVVADDCVNRLEIEVDNWVTGGQVNQASFEEISNMLQQSITFFIAKSVELSGLHSKENGDEQIQTSVPNVHHLTSPTVKYRPDAEQSDMMPRRKQVMHGGGEVEAHTSHILAMRLGILEEAVFSLKMTTEKVQEKQENIGHTLKDVSIQQENFDKAVEIFNKTNLKFKKQIEETITELEKKSNDISSNVDHLFETVTNIDNRLNRLDEENESVNSAINEVNRQFTSFKRCSSDALISLQDLSKSVESTYQHYDEMSNKMNKLQISMNLMSSQYSEQFENKGGLNKDKVDDLHSKVDALTSQAMDLFNQITVIKSKCCLPHVGFYAFKKLNHTDGRHELQNFEIVNGNYGNHFDPASGKFDVPLSGLYLMSITAKLAEKSSISVLHYQPCEFEVCTLLGKQTITCCCELKGGDKVGLKLSVKEEKTQTRSGNVLLKCDKCRNKSFIFGFFTLRMQIRLDGVDHKTLQCSWWAL